MGIDGMERVTMGENFVLFGSLKNKGSRKEGELFLSLPPYNTNFCSLSNWGILNFNYDGHFILEIL